MIAEYTKFNFIALVAELINAGNLRERRDCLSEKYQNKTLADRPQKVLWRRVIGRVILDSNGDLPALAEWLNTCSLHLSYN